MTYMHKTVNTYYIKNMFYNQDSWCFSDHAPQQHFDRWACISISYAKRL